MVVEIWVRSSRIGGGERPWRDMVAYGEKGERVEGDAKNGFKVLTDVFMRNRVV